MIKDFRHRDYLAKAELHMEHIIKSALLTHLLLLCEQLTNPNSPTDLDLVFPSPLKSHLSAMSTL